MPTITPVRKSYDEAAKQIFAVLAGASAASQTGKNARCWTFANDELATKTNASYDSTNKVYNGWAYTQSQLSIAGGTPGPATLLGQSFKVDNTNKIVGFKWEAYSNMTGYVFDWTIESDNAGAPSGTALASVSNVAGPGAATWQELQFATPFTPAANTTYWLVARLHGGGSLPTNMWGFASAAYSNGQSTAAATYDMAFGIAQIFNMTLVPPAITVASAPYRMVAEFFIQVIGSFTLDTDIKVEVSRDGGSNWSSYRALQLVGQYDATYNQYMADFPASLLSISGTSLQWRLTSYNGINMKLHGATMHWEL